MQDLYKSQISNAFEDFNKSLKIEDLDLSKISFPTEDVWQNDTFKVVLQDQIRQAMEDFQINQVVAVPAPVTAPEPLPLPQKKNVLEVGQNILEISIGSIPKVETTREPFVEPIIEPVKEPLSSALPEESKKSLGIKKPLARTKTLGLL